FMETTVKDWKFSSTLPPLLSDSQIQSIKAPMLTIAAEQDIAFPGGPMIERLTRVRPETKTELIANCKHCPPTTDDFRQWLCNRLMEFFDVAS
ncbi:MAG: hypothetical protein AAF664_19050, partial [Planctomycetota bacterium]